MITDELRKGHCTVFYAPGDADVDIVKAAVKASLIKLLRLLAKIPIYLSYYFITHSQIVKISTLDQTSQELMASIKYMTSNEYNKSFGNDTCVQLLLIHSVTGCDTTSRLYGVGKKKVFQKLMKGDPVLQSCARAFTTPNQTTELIDDLGCQGRKCTESLAKMRYNTFSKKVASGSSFVTPKHLPPTEFAAKLHCRRAYYQIMKALIPDSLLKVIHCNCSNNCKTYLCSCRRYGLSYTTACGLCQFEQLDNTHKLLPELLYGDDEY
ncbi:hypothetical protein PR048_019797 [Dryococelus australis]|uniref:Uncharacterized protein n=1 Tax=Dryococelus australis TaxID=614101 RepID=A0ABQ9H4I5_9NEOP|nr:hypothetical protein PR048_019797 [Dryococelus australis]